MRALRRMKVIGQVDWEFYWFVVQNQEGMVAQVD